MLRDGRNGKVLSGADDASRGCGPRLTAAQKAEGWRRGEQMALVARAKVGDRKRHATGARTADRAAQGTVVDSTNTGSIARGTAGNTLSERDTRPGQLELITMTERVAQAATPLGLQTLMLLVFAAGIFIGGLLSEWLSKSSPDPAVPVAS